MIRPAVSDSLVKDLHWLAGFTYAEGCFVIRIFKSKTNISEAVQLIFQLTQHSRDEKLMRSLIEYFDCGNILQRGKAFDFIVTKLSDIENKIIRLFKKHPIHGVKAKDFQD